MRTNIIEKAKEIRRQEMTRQKKINEQVAEAKRVLDKNYGGKVNNMEVIITSTKLTARSKKESFGLRFNKINELNIGDVIKNDDRSISRVEAII